MNNTHGQNFKTKNSALNTKSQDLRIYFLKKIKLFCSVLDPISFQKYAKEDLQIICDNENVSYFNNDENLVLSMMSDTFQTLVTQNAKFTTYAFVSLKEIENFQIIYRCNLKKGQKVIELKKWDDLNKETMVINLKKIFLNPFYNEKELLLFIKYLQKATAITESMLLNFIDKSKNTNLLLKKN